MKKIYTTILLVIISFALRAQVNDTLTIHFQGIPTFYSSGQGFVAGQNEYGDKAKLQLFDANYGVTGPGIIPAILTGVRGEAENPQGFLQLVIWVAIPERPEPFLGRCRDLN